jgi:hypothetical protein
MRGGGGPGGGAEADRDKGAQVGWDEGKRRARRRGGGKPKERSRLAKRR